MVEALLFRLPADSVGLTLGPHKVRFELNLPILLFQGTNYRSYHL
jgi:hypothetical protein